MSEEVVVVNEDDEIIGTMPKDEAHKNGVPHRVAFTYVENSVGQILIQIRMSGRLDHSSAGHVKVGESYEEAAIRELEEELGIRGVSLEYVGKGSSIEKLGHDGGNRFHVFQLFRCVAEPGNLQEDEVRGVYWADPKKVLEEMRASGLDAVKFGGGFLASLPIYLDNK